MSMKTKLSHTILILFATFNIAIASPTPPTVLGQDLAEEYNVIITAVPFLQITPDSRSAAMADVGVATSTDVWSQYSNASKYVTSPNDFGVGFSYVPWMHNVGVTDENILYLSGYKKLSNNDALAGSIRYFSMGSAPSYDAEGNDEGYDVSPREYSFDMSYSRRLADCFAMGMTARFVYSDLIGEANDDMHSGKAVAFDISGIYRKRIRASSKSSMTKPRYTSQDVDMLSIGFCISNIGSKLSYSANSKDFLPMNLKLGFGYTKLIDAKNKLSAYLDFNKLLVPTPPQYVYDSDGNVVEIKGKDKTVGVLTGFFQSFGDAPGGLKEELKEYTIGIGAEYWYDNMVAARLGYFNEAETKGNRKYFTVGLGYSLKQFEIDFSYLLPTNGKKSPLSNTIRVSLSYEFEK